MRAVVLFTDMEYSSSQCILGQMASHVAGEEIMHVWVNLSSVSITYLFLFKCRKPHKSLCLISFFYCWPGSQYLPICVCVAKALMFDSSLIYIDIINPCSSGIAAYIWAGYNTSEVSLGFFWVISWWFTSNRLVGCVGHTTYSVHLLPLSKVSAQVFETGSRQLSSLIWRRLQ